MLEINTDNLDEMSSYNIGEELVAAVYTPYIDVTQPEVTKLAYNGGLILCIKGSKAKQVFDVARDFLNKGAGTVRNI